MALVLGKFCSQRVSRGYCSHQGRYNIGRAQELCFSLAEAELIVTAALIGLGATRQARSHIKACIALGVPEADVEAVIETSKKLKKWQDAAGLSPQASVDVKSLARQAKETLATR